MTPESGTTDHTEYLLLTPQQLITGSRKELLAVLKKVDPTGFAPSNMPELRNALLNIAFTQDPVLKAMLRRASNNEPLPKQSDDQDLPPTISTACSTSPSTPYSIATRAFGREACTAGISRVANTKHFFIKRAGAEATEATAGQAR